MSASRPARSSSRAPWLIAVFAIVVLAAAGGGLWYLFFRPSGPAPVALASASPAAPGASQGSGSGAGSGALDGTWTVDPSVGSFSDFSGTFAGYRVQEKLANVGATTAVGRTPDVTGTFTLAGSQVTAATFEVNLTTLVSDERFRDGQLKRQALETDAFPSATFTLTAPADLGGVPAEGKDLSVTVTGDLTLHGTTKQVQIPLQARLSGGVVAITGSLEIAFADFGISKPQSMMVLSVEDHGTLELQLQLKRS